MTADRRNSRNIRRTLYLGAAVGALVAFCSPVAAEDGRASTTNTAAQDSGAATTGAGPIEERQQYALRLMTQIYDGKEDLSHTQIVGIGRVRKGNRSVTQMDFGDGAVVIQGSQGELSASRFMNVSEIEKLVVYNYSDKTIEGDGEIGYFHNFVVRPLLGKGPELGSDASWTEQLSVAALGLAEASGGTLNVELSREYFTFDGMPMVLIHYAVPAFTYDTPYGNKVVHWARGIALSDPGFGMIYLNSTLHRAVAMGRDSSGTPYRYARTMVAANPDGSAMIDYRKVPQLQPYIDQLFSKEAMQVVPPESTPEQPDQAPLGMARNLDIIALSIVEDGANDAPIVGAGQTANDRGREIFNQSMSELSQGTIAAGIYGNASQVLADSAEEKQLFEAIRSSMVKWQTAGASLEIKLNGAVGEMKALERAGALEVKATLKPQFLPAEQGIAVAEKNHAAVVAKYSETLARLEDLEIGTKPFDDLLRQLNQLSDQQDITRAILDERWEILQAIVKDSKNFYMIPANPEIFEQYQDAAKAVDGLSSDIAKHGSEGLRIATEVKKIPPTRFQAFRNVLGGGLTLLGNAMNGYTFGSSLANFQNQVGGDLGSGQLALTRTYGSSISDGQTGYTLGGLKDINLGLDLLGLAGSALSGDVVSTITTAAAISTGSITDIILSGMGASQAQVQAADAAIARYKTELAALENRRKKRDEQLTKFEAVRKEVAGLSDEIDEMAADRQKRSQQLLDERRKAREEIRRQQEEADRLARAEEERLRLEELARQEEFERRRTANDRLKKEFEPDYPTAPPRPKDGTGIDRPTPPPAPTVLTLAERAEIEREQRRQQSQRELDEYQARKLAERDPNASTLPESFELRTSALETSALLTSTFDIKPVTFKPVTFEAPEFKMPVFDEDGDLFVKDEEGNTVLRKVGPDFKPPKISEFPPTDPNDEDGYPGTGQYPAFTYENMSAKEPDISKWEKWLATQDIRRLEQMAIGAGYPSLAFALADAENIIRKSLDAGFRSYANRGPNCAGTTGCTGSLGPWRLAYATIRLGDILAESREIFSTGGFSDIGISGFNLMYLLRDFGIEDGDLIDVQISQFGRPIFELKSHFLLNAGSAFNVNLRPGVAQMVITAVNEGSISPNTAEVLVQNVVRGAARQTYSLRTGQTAVLRIEANAKAGNQGAGNNGAAAARGRGIIRSEAPRLHALDRAPERMRIQPHSHATIQGER